MFQSPQQKYLWYRGFRWEATRYRQNVYLQMPYVLLSLPGDTIKLFVIARGERDLPAEENLSCDLRIALRRFESREAKLVLGIIRDVEVEVGFTHVKHPQGFCGDCGI